MDINKKLEILKSNLRKLESIAVAYSGGVDSTFLLKVAADELGNNALAITVKSGIFPQWEYEETVELTEKLGIKHIIIEVDEMNIDGFEDNPTNRCYICKRQVFRSIIKAADENNKKFVADGSNVDDLKDYRPGMAALKELGIVSPLREADMTKEDIRLISRSMGLPTWDKPPFACLASRIPYGEKITREKLIMIDRGEQYLQSLGFRQVRVRHHGNIARIEVDPDERCKFIGTDIMDMIYNEFKNIGFDFTALDLKGYRTGSLNIGVDRAR